MFYTDTIDQMNFLIAVCFSFCIFVFSLWLKNANTLSRLLGFTFFIPFMLNTASFITHVKAVSISLTAIAGPLLLVLIFILLVTKPSKKQFITFQYILLSIPLILTFICDYIKSAGNFLSEPLNILVPLGIMLILNMHILKKEIEKKSILFWAIITFTAGTVTGVLLDEGIVSYASPALNFLAYIMFMVFFYNEYFGNLMAKGIEADNNTMINNRSIDYEGFVKRVIEIERVNENLDNISNIDALSKAFNKAAILDAIEKTILTKPKDEFSIIMVDIDNFKTINDTLGHVIGDKCIKTLSVIAKSNFREFDIIGRYDVAEFIILLHGINTFQAFQIAERFRKRVLVTEEPHYTVSIGIATHLKDSTTVEGLVEAAGKRLYKSMRTGRNTVSYGDDY